MPPSPGVPPVLRRLPGLVDAVRAAVARECTQLLDKVAYIASKVRAVFCVLWLAARIQLCPVFALLQRWEAWRRAPRPQLTAPRSFPRAAQMSRPGMSVRAALRLASSEVEASGGSYKLVALTRPESVASLASLSSRGAPRLLPASSLDSSSGGRGSGGGGGGSGASRAGSRQSELSEAAQSVLAFNPRLREVHSARSVASLVARCQAAGGADGGEGGA